MVTTLAPKVPKIDSNDFFFITNTGTDIVRFRWDGLEYAIDPGGRKLVPFDVVCLNYGDPRSRVGGTQGYEDSKGKGVVPDRDLEVLRLSVLYGVYEQGAQDILSYIEVENRRLTLNGDLPLSTPNIHVKITTTDDPGVEIIPPLFDPKGTYAAGYTPDNPQSNDIAVLLGQYQDRIEHLEKMIEVSDRTGHDNTGEIPVDEPHVFQ